MGQTIIQWCRYTFNMWFGCRKVAPECENCYITSTLTFLFRKITHGSRRDPAAVSSWKNPYAWDRKAAREGVRERVFSLSLGDWLDAEVAVEWLAELLKIISETPNLDWLLLTKRAQNFRNRLFAVKCYLLSRIHATSDAGCQLMGDNPDYAAFRESAISMDLESLKVFNAEWSKATEMVCAWLNGDIDDEGDIPPKNVWIGVSAGADLEAALAIPAVIHFLSCEPMLHALDYECAKKFDWIIFGGESGPKARPLELQWIYDGLWFCRHHGIAAFVKQLGRHIHAENRTAWPEGTDWRCAGPWLKDSHGGDMEEWPEDLRVREFPRVEAKV